MAKSFDANQFYYHLDNYFQKCQARNPSIPTHIKLFSQKLDVNYTFPSNADNKPFHIASIGKVFTAVLVQLLAEEGSLSLNDPIQSFFNTRDLERLFLYQGVDYVEKVTIKELLGHTSGIADYFEGRTTTGMNYVEELLSNSQKSWTPNMLIDYTRNNQEAVNIPGRCFHYSDTGYILLGLIIESVTGISFAKNLEEKIFAPLNMKDSYLMFYSETNNQPQKTIEHIWFNNVEISKFKIINSDFSGGGIVSTTNDLLLFSRALQRGHLIKKEILEKMSTCCQKFCPGIHYGLGIMEIHFDEFFFLLRGLPRIKGHTGIFSTHLYFDPVNDAHIIMNLGSNKRMGESIRAMIKIELFLKKLKTNY